MNAATPATVAALAAGQPTPTGMPCSSCKQRHQTLRAAVSCQSSHAARSALYAWADREAQDVTLAEVKQLLGHLIPVTGHQGAIFAAQAVLELGWRPTDEDPQP